MIYTLPDTSVWISFLRTGAWEPFLRRSLRSGAVVLASVVAHELYAGASTLEDKHDLDEIQSGFVAAGLTITPAFEDWCAAGTLMARYGRLHGALDPRAHLNDVLIVLCASRAGAALVTHNTRDMLRWARMLPRTRRVRVMSPPVR